MPAHWATNSGNSVTTSMRMISLLLRSEVRIPVDDDAPGLHVHVLDVPLHHEWQHPFTAAVAYHQHVVGAGGDQMADPAEIRAIHGHDLQAFQIGPVELAPGRLRQLLAGDGDIAADQCGCRIAAVHTGQPGHQTLALLPAADAIHFANRARRGFQLPGPVFENAFARLGPGFQLDLALNAEYPDDAPHRDAPRGRAHAQAAACSSAGACLAASLASARTLSLICAPLATQALTLSTSSSRRFSAPEATGL